MKIALKEKMAKDKAQKEMDSLRKRIAEHFPKEKDAAS